MFRYSPPKSNTWGHSLRNMPPAQQKALFNDFLKKAVAEHSFCNGGLKLFIGPPPAFLPLEAQGMWGHVTKENVQRFEQLLGTDSRNADFSLTTPQQFELALNELIQNEALIPGAMLTQLVRISKWLINDQAVPTESIVMLYYGMNPRVATFLEFQTMDEFEFVKRVLSDLQFCKLNDKHLKPIKQGGKEKK